MRRISSDFFVVGVDEVLQTLVVTAVDNMLLQSIAEGLINGGTAALSLYVNSKLLKCYYMLHLDVGGGGFIRWVSPGRACSSVTSEFKDMLIH